ncbi:hypothetical protein M409DRAFT_55467 [Zasmidium cellare ATCC 36951]|uniref:Heterokaryon incompatibility domain-containing protein n=1 Tax=Zasmidium cellare ATCC 36951 TaxID=1080233 RepID=A0A6A6CK94_ZASCE|nr:uncharacterized protein M409DRAFT_55467 [Zasmidium cellare ATCC 36951]KAF2166129.1 hypothetical protein M409DRAFT_55467 [Zasmidium cellare ATCC 36951]
MATLVWLGCSTPNSTAAVEVLHSLALLARQHNAFAGMERNDFGPFVFEKQPSGASVFIRDEDMLMAELDSDRKCSTACLSRKPGKSDETIFQFKNFELWCEIDGMFSNSYFQRTWIEREVAKAPHVKICRGPHIISWSLFTSAFVGRSLLLFHPQHPGLRFTGSLQTVMDARQRWRTPEHGTTLAGALVALTYSKETRKHDHIYAAYAMSKYTIEWLETSGHNLDIEELMLRTSCACIQETDDLYHLGQWCHQSEGDEPSHMGA